MFKKFNILILSLTIMFFSNSGNAKYEKIFFDFNIKSIEGNEINLENFKNNVILLVNTASYCGFTNQYDGLQKIYQKYKDRGLIVMGVPSNSFNQEKNEESEIKQFCEVNFDITFPMTSIYDVRGENAHPIYKWAKDNHGKSAVPKWNFHKIIINKEGKIEETFSSLTKPSSNKILSVLDKLLN